ncbi:uncharacterized protein ACR2FA_002103 isoform 2-T2 [Aphomia sociella]
MDITLLLLALTMLWKTSAVSASVRCFKCEPRFSHYQTDLNTCELFDSSDKFVQQCNSSTMCYKKKITINIGNDLTTYERGCAYQTMSGDQKKINGKWILVNNIYEVYKENCEEDVSAEHDRLTNSLHCYCRGDLCNAATKLSKKSLILMLCSIISLSVVRYMI